MISPSLVLGMVLATLYSLAFYLIFGRGWLRLVFFWSIGVAGFFIGHWIASLIGLSVFGVGGLNVVEGTLVSWVCLFAARAWRQ